MDNKESKKNGIFNKKIKIKLLCYPRILGYVFNPLSIFFIYDQDNYLISILYEVKNTFGEQHTYVFKTKKVNDLIENTCNKKFHVSPFIDMNCKYYFRVLNPQNKLSVVINQSDDEKLTSKNLIF